MRIDGSEVELSINPKMFEVEGLQQSAYLCQGQQSPKICQLLWTDWNANRPLSQFNKKLNFDVFFSNVEGLLADDKFIC